MDRGVFAEAPVSAYARMFAVHRLGTLDDLTDCAVFLAAEDAGHLTGQICSRTAMGDALMPIRKEP
jgi:hypothetical protein